MIYLKKILLNILIGIVIFFAGYFGLNFLLKKPVTYPGINCPEHITQKNIIVDSLLIVVDSLTVQADSLHRSENKVNLVFVPQKVDTASIIAKYYSIYNYSIRHRNKDLDLSLNFDYSQDKIRNTKLEYKILKPVSIIKPVPQRSKHLFFGATLGGSQFEMDQFTPEIIFFNGKHGFKIGYNLMDQNRNFQIGYYFKIR